LTKAAHDGAVSVRFLGGAGTVTGSRFLVESGGTRILVDCGLYQGLKPLRLRNWAPLAFDPASLDAVVLTHAHIDHSGFLPVLVREGYGGPIHATAPTVDLCGILLPDSGHIQEEDAAFANRHGFSKHKPALPLYDEATARKVLPLLEPAAFGEAFRVGGVTISLRRAGHILGAASALCEADGRRVLFSGDLGQGDDPICPPPDPPPAVDLLVMESTYGDRLHGEVDAVGLLARLIGEVVASGGTLLVPAFAVGRVQNLLLWLDRVFAEGRAPRIPVIVDSPMATSVTELYGRHHDAHRLSDADCGRIFGGARFVQTVQDSKRLAFREGPMVLISASGMMTGGRVLHHFKRIAPDPRSVVLLPGYMAPGTRGAALVAGADAVKIHGGYVPVRARVEHADAFSAHADRAGLLDWVAAAEAPPKRIVLVHGEATAADSLRLAVQDRFAIDCTAAEHNEIVVVR
jgi:metallo-beta-lactamase family protein